MDKISFIIPNSDNKVTDNKVTDNNVTDNKATDNNTYTKITTNVVFLSVPATTYV